MKKAGAETIDVAVPGLDDLLRDSSLINAEFKFDLADYLARQPNAGTIAGRDSRARTVSCGARIELARAQRGRETRERSVSARDDQTHRDPAGC
jgi:hypothetical protein